MGGYGCCCLLNFCVHLGTNAGVHATAHEREFVGQHTRERIEGTWKSGEAKDRVNTGVLGTYAEIAP